MERRHRFNCMNNSFARFIRKAAGQVEKMGAKFFCIYDSVFLEIGQKPRNEKKLYTRHNFTLSLLTLNLRSVTQPGAIA